MYCPHYMSEHMRWCYNVSSYNFTKPPFGSSYKLTNDPNRMRSGIASCSSDDLQTKLLSCRDGAFDHRNMFMFFKRRRFASRTAWHDATYSAVCLKVNMFFKSTQIDFRTVLREWRNQGGVCASECQHGLSLQTDAIQSMKKLCYSPNPAARAHSLQSCSARMRSLASAINRMIGSVFDDRRCTHPSGRSIRIPSVWFSCAPVRLAK